MLAIDCSKHRICFQGCLRRFWGIFLGGAVVSVLTSLGPTVWPSYGGVQLPRSTSPWRSGMGQKAGSGK